jgi:hypothetical protein
MDQMTLIATTFARDPSSRPAAQAHKQAAHQMLAPFPVAYFIWEPSSPTWFTGECLM